jgi:hypothetical protein
LTAEQARILNGIRANDGLAIREAGRSRDRIYLEALAAALPRRRDLPWGLPRSAGSSPTR